VLAAHAERHAGAHPAHEVIGEGVAQRLDIACGERVVQPSGGCRLIGHGCLPLLGVLESAR
jgi:hypothetical protein